MPLTPERKRLDTARATRLALAALAAASLLALPAASVASRARQQTGKAQRIEKQPEIIDDDDVLKIDTDLVLVEVTVTDAGGRPVRGLRPEDFKLYEDGDERPVAFLNVERREGAERPVAVVFAVDVSGSMTAEERGTLQPGAGAFPQQVPSR